MCCAGSITMVQTWGFLILGNIDFVIFGSTFCLKRADLILNWNIAICAIASIHYTNFMCQIVFSFDITMLILIFLLIPWRLMCGVIVSPLSIQKYCTLSYKMTNLPVLFWHIKLRNFRKSCPAILNSVYICQRRHTWKQATLYWLKTISPCIDERILDI